MARRSKFEKMLEHLVNDDRKGAEILFHDIVVDKSRQIYESLLEDEYEDENEFDDMGGDPTDDLESDVDIESEDEEDENEFSEEGENEELEDRIVDLEDALDDLKAEFESMMSGDEEDSDIDSEEDEEDIDFDSEEDEEDIDFDSEEDEEDIEESYDEENAEDTEDEEDEEDNEELKDSVQAMREYVEKVSNPTPGDNGSFTQSTVASPNRMSGNNGTTNNIARSDTDNRTQKKTSPKVDDHGNRNKPGGKASKLNSVSKPKMGDKGSEKSMLGSNKRRK